MKNSPVFPGTVKTGEKVETNIGSYGVEGFPTPPKKLVLVDETVYSPGLSKRELFAAMAMQNLQNVLLRKSGETQLSELLTIQEQATAKPACASDVIAKMACIQADALIAELEKSK
jgi:hypothetical protein